MENNLIFSIGFIVLCLAIAYYGILKPLLYNWFEDGIQRERDKLFDEWNSRNLSTDNYAYKTILGLCDKILANHMSVSLLGLLSWISRNPNKIEDVGDRGEAGIKAEIEEFSGKFIRSLDECPDDARSVVGHATVCLIDFTIKRVCLNNPALAIIFFVYLPLKKKLSPFLSAALEWTSGIPAILSLRNDLYLRGEKQDLAMFSRKLSR